METYTRAAVEMMGRMGVHCEKVGYLDVVRVLNKFDLYVRQDDKSVAPHLRNEGFWEAWVTAWVMNNAGPGTVFIDIGANTGYYAFLAHHLGAKVHAFEPNIDYVDLLCFSNDRNNFDIVIHQEALSNAIGEAVLHIPRELQGSASLSDIDSKHDVKKVTVPMTRLDDVFSSFSAEHTIVKIDAEGEEERIWEGAARLFNGSPGDVTVLLEYTPGAYSDKFIGVLQDFGDLCWVNHNGLEEPVTKEWILAQTDWVMLVIRKRR